MAIDGGEHVGVRFGILREAAHTPDFVQCLATDCAGFDWEAIKDAVRCPTHALVGVFMSCWGWALLRCT